MWASVSKECCGGDARHHRGHEHPAAEEIAVDPVCGMALEPTEVSLGKGSNEALIDMSRRFRIGLVLSLPVVALEMGGHLFSLHALIDTRASNWVQFLLATPVVLCGLAGPSSSAAGSRCAPVISTGAGAVPGGLPRPCVDALR